jgi:hypothetical protein
VKRELVAVEDAEGYFDEDYSFESYTGYSRGGSYDGGDGGGHVCQLCGKCYKSAGSLKNHRSLYHRSEIGKNRGIMMMNAEDMGNTGALDDFSLDQIDKI